MISPFIYGIAFIIAHIGSIFNLFLYKKYCKHQVLARVILSEAKIPIKILRFARG